MSNKKTKKSKKTNGTKKSTNSKGKKGATKKNPKKNIIPVLTKETYRGLYFVISVLIIILSVLQMGFVGRFFDSLFKYLFGSFSYILYIIIVATPIYYIMNKKIKTPAIVVTLLVLIDFLFQLILVGNAESTYISFTEIYNGKVLTYGGGLISYYPVKFLIYLLSYYGSLLVVISAIITSIFLYFNINHRTLVLRLKHQIVDAFDKNEYVDEEHDEYLEFDEEIIDDYNYVDTKKENSNEQRYNNIKDKDLVVDIREFKEEPEEELVQRVTRKLAKSKEVKSVDVVEESLNEAVSEESYDNYQLPPITLLNSPVKKQTITKGDVVEKSKILQSTFNNFGIEVKIVKAIVGPSITQFQILPTPGTKVSKIVNLSNDIALNLAAKDVRIEAPIPGKSLIGIEIPNTVNELVTMKEVFVNDEDNSPLSVALGKDVSGESIFTRIDKTPHLLIAGSTGSGKSVCVNTIITSILLKNKPDKVKLIMIDPKMVELSIYDGIPHLLTSVVTDPIKAADVLHKVVLEMENRYREFARARVRNMEGYNKIAAKDPDYKELPYIVVIIDELADLMMVSSKEVEESIARIAQKARAAGIHMIIATQRPSVDVITGVIKTNIPSRIAFAVSSSIDSRTILDKSGAETLLGKGDMLYLSADSSKPVRIQGAFLSDEEVEKVVDYVKSQSEAQYDPNMTPSEVTSQGSGSSSADDVDPLYKEVLLFIAKTQKASASLLQRRFKIGYNRAARIIDMLEEDGYIGPVDGSKPRKVFLEKEFAEDYE
ncbi:MAG: DNA translocase FtsK [Gemella haemolysans]|uniref:DNA translocase FtsK n=1 Tax=Gemella haemolysans TaxID=1379 RepID=UPI00291126B9|nr:DNA translocase FtsK [Gemella haemolysans]MDU4714998.1 DNA translocase FtsK [Gemella haemolysans]